MKEAGVALKAELVIPLVTTPGGGDVKDREREHQQWAKNYLRDRLQ